MTSPLARQLTADRDVCRSTGLCVAACPQVFGHDSESLVVLNRDAIGPHNEAQVRDAVDNCPTGALSLEQIQDD